MKHRGWIGVDFDGTLAVYDTWVSPEHCGEPIKPMVDQVKQWLADGREVRIFTARVYFPPDQAGDQASAAKALLAIQGWCEKHLGKVLPVTCIKDYEMDEFWDDRAVQTHKNEGRRVDGK